MRLLKWTKGVWLDVVERKREGMRRVEIERVGSLVKASRDEDSVAYARDGGLAEGWGQVSLDPEARPASKEASRVSHRRQL